MKFLPNIQHTKSGTIRKTESTFEVLVPKQQPDLQMQAYIINLYSVFDIASALQQGCLFLITVTSRPWKYHLEMRQAYLKALISKVYPVNRSDRCN